MEPLDLGPKRGPEYIIQKDLVKLLESKGWFVKETHGNQYQSGFPDLFCTHRIYGHRWIDVKVAGRYRITPAQRRDWPKFCKAGSGVWILVAATETEYKKLFRAHNWWHYLENMK
jgi:hypothetical protein